MHESTLRKRRLRAKRRQDGWEQFELWLPPDTAALLAELRQLGEPVHHTIHQALAALQAVQVGPVETLDPVQRKAALVARLHQLKAQGLSLQAIAQQLDAEGVPTISGRGQWQAGTVGKLLKAYPREGT